MNKNSKYQSRNEDKMNDIIRTKIEQVIDPTLKKSLKETGGIKHIGYDDEKDVVTLIIAMGQLGGTAEKELQRAITKIIKIDLGHAGVKLQFEEFKKINSITNSSVIFIGIVSGKGGVGKSSIAANIAYRLTKKGHKTALMDADIYGSSIPTIMEIVHQNPYFDENKKILPLIKDDIELISTELFTDPSQPVIWRGGMLHSMLEHFFYDVKWNAKTEFMLIDLPPGTGDIALDIKQHVPQAKMLVITTPHPNASHVAVKAGFAAQALGHDIIGVIENMSYYYNEATKEKDYVFGEGGGKTVAEALNTELIAQLPLSQPKHHQSLFEIDEPVGRIYDIIADYIILKTQK